MLGTYRHNMLRTNRQYTGEKDTLWWGQTGTICWGHIDTICSGQIDNMLGKTRIVRGSDYSPAFELFARVRQTMKSNNPKLDFVNVDAHKKIGQILKVLSRNKILTSIQGQNSVKSLQKNDKQQS